MQEVMLFPKQVQAIQYLNDGTTREILFGGAKGGAKSFLGAFYFIGSPMMYPETFYFIARAELTDLRKYTIPTLHEVSNKLGFNLTDEAKYNGQDNFFEFSNGSRIYLIACKYMPSDPQFTRFGSMQMTQGWIEEGGEIHELAYENLKLSIGRWNNKKYNLPYKLLITANPTKNWLYNEFYKPYKNGSLGHDKAFLQSLATDNFAHSTDYIRTLDNIADPVTKARLRYGDWEYSDNENQLMQYEAITDIFTNSFVFNDNDNTYITADIAMFGADKFVVWVWKGLSIIDYLVKDKSTPTEIEEDIKGLAEKYSVPRSRVAYDADGVGTYLKSYLAGAIPINNNHKSYMAGFANCKTEFAFKLAELVNDRKIYIKVQLPAEIRIRLTQELEAVRRTNVDNEKNLQIESKDKMKERLSGKSPDFLDAMLYRMIFVIFNK